MGAVVAMAVKPKSVRHKHRQHDIILTFVPATATEKARWEYQAIIIRRYEFDGEADSEQAALKAAQKKIDAFADNK